MGHVITTDTCHDSRVILYQQLAEECAVEVEPPPWHVATDDATRESLKQQNMSGAGKVE
jgi:hypothetical protein